MRDLEGKAAIVSGGSRGIGRACALELARRGAKVAITYQGNEAAARETLELIAREGSAGVSRQFDVADSEACQRAVDELAQELGRVDVLVNNAGIVHDGLLMRLKDEDWERVLSVNLSGALRLARAVCRPMLKQRGGSIVNLASIVGEMGNSGQVAYAASKSGLLGFTKALARELASRGVRVNAVSPGFIDTEMVGHLPAEWRDQIVGQVPLGRLGRPEEVARAVAFLASEQSSYITGEVLRVNGGLLT